MIVSLYKTSVQMLSLSLPDKEVLAVLDAQEESPRCLGNIVQRLDRQTVLPLPGWQGPGWKPQSYKSQPGPDMRPAGMVVLPDVVGSQVAEVDRHPDRQEELEDEGDQDCGHVARLLEEYL